MSTPRPVIRNLKRSRADLALEVLSFVGLMVLLFVPAYYYRRLPETIPQHFNFKGEADGWGGKGTLFLLPALGLAMYLGLTVLSFFPHIFNYPWPITEANARRQYALSRQLISAVKLCLVVTFAYLTWAVIQTGAGNQKGLPGWFAFGLSPVLFAIIGLYIYRARQAR